LSAGFFGDFLHPDWQNHFKENLPCLKPLNEILGAEFAMVKKGGAVITVAANGKIVVDEQGDFLQACCVLQDITGRKQMEEKFMRSKKLESISVFAGGILHDFNNLLSIIIGNIEIAEDELKTESGGLNFLKEARYASLQARDLTRQFLALSTSGTPNKKAGSIGDLIKKTAGIALVGNKVKADFMIPSDLWPAEFDENQMAHVFENLFVNAVESIPQGGVIDVRLENFVTGNGNKELSLQDGKYVKISIKDSGIGISKKHLPLIFDPYFSTKEKGVQKGMGLGLATSYSIINKHSGCITVDSKLREGTTLTIYLPAIENHAQETAALRKN